jgi:phage terminase large subunit-like protein
VSGGCDGGHRLLTALLRHAAAAGCPLALEEARSTAWASVTFAGARHRIAVAADDTDAFAQWLAALPHAEFAIPRQLVADAAVAEVTRGDGCVRAVLEVLTLIED